MCGMQHKYYPSLKKLMAPTVRHGSVSFHPRRDGRGQCYPGQSLPRATTPDGSRISSNNNREKRKPNMKSYPPKFAENSKGCIKKEVRYM